MDFQNFFSLLISWFLHHGIKVIFILIAAYFIVRVANVFTTKIIKKDILKLHVEVKKILEQL